ncbi:Cysteinyl-tRNA synthetase, class Ia family protein [Trifolium repens]|nr:Cysteinyl-tRNA synthetase, class Ia family protein [Trifolium repens]
MVTLNCLPPTVEPKVSEHMPQIIDMIEKILNNGYVTYVYNVDADIYFNVEKFPEYGKSSSRGLEDNRAGERVAVDSRKYNLNTIDNFYDVFLTSMYDDLHTPVVLAGLSDPLKSINDLLHTRKGKKQQFRIESLAALKKSIGDFLSVLGLMPSSYYEECLNFCALNRDLIKSGSYFLFYFQQEYAKFDAIRKDLAVVGIAVMDSPNGTTWRPSIPFPLQEQL